MGRRTRWFCCCWEPRGVESNCRELPRDGGIRRRRRGDPGMCGSWGGTWAWWVGKGGRRRGWGGSWLLGRLRRRRRCRPCCCILRWSCQWRCGGGGAGLKKRLPWSKVGTGTRMWRSFQISGGILGLISPFSWWCLAGEKFRVLMKVGILSVQLKLVGGSNKNNLRFLSSVSSSSVNGAYCVHFSFSSFTFLRLVLSSKTYEDFIFFPELFFISNMIFLLFNVVHRSSYHQYPIIIWLKLADCPIPNMIIRWYFS